MKSYNEVYSSQSARYAYGYAVEVLLEHLRVLVNFTEGRRMHAKGQSKQISSHSRLSGEDNPHIDLAVAYESFESSAT